MYSQSHLRRIAAKPGIRWCRCDVSDDHVFFRSNQKAVIKGDISRVRSSISIQLLNSDCALFYGVTARICVANLYAPRLSFATLSHNHSISAKIFSYESPQLNIATRHVDNEFTHAAYYKPALAISPDRHMEQHLAIYRY